MMNWKILRTRVIVSVIVVAGLATGRYVRLISSHLPNRVELRTADELFARDDTVGQLLFIARSDCPACAMVRPTWEQLAARAPDEALVRHITSTSDTGPGSTLDASEVHYETAARSTLLDAGVDAIPTTVVIDRTGEIAFNKVGLLTPEDVDSITELLR